MNVKVRFLSICKFCLNYKIIYWVLEKQKKVGTIFHKEELQGSLNRMNFLFEKIENHTAELTSISMEDLAHRLDTSNQQLKETQEEVSALQL